MFTTPLLFLSLLLAGDVAGYESTFTERTLRFDYFHTGTATEEAISLDAIRLEPGRWPGRRTHLQDDSNLGKYRFELVDYATHRTIFSSNFSSIYGEWETIGEARAGVHRSFHESQRFPEPRRKAQLVLKKRAADGSFKEIYSAVFDPQSRFVDRAVPPARGEVVTIFENGPVEEKVDLLLLGDGYTAAEADAFAADARRIAGYLFDFPPFDRLKSRFNVRALAPPSPGSGITDPRAERWISSPLGLSYNAFDSERYMLTYENRALREVAAHAPYDVLILISNSEKYGGGGIYNLWSTAAAQSPQAPYLIVHEFGHAFAGLGDEYYTASVAYEGFNPPGVEPWEPNVTALLVPEEIKWGHLVEEGAPLPTPWDQETYDRISLAFQKRRAELRAGGATEEEMESYFQEVKETTAPILAEGRHAGKIGAFEGAGYQAKGLYRPAADCIMFTRNPDHFCAVCSEAIEAIVRQWTE